MSSENLKGRRNKLCVLSSGKVIYLVQLYTVKMRNIHFVTLLQYPHLTCLNNLQDHHKLPKVKGKEIL